MYIHVLFAKARHDDLLRAAAQSRFAAQAQRAVTALRLRVIAAQTDRKTPG